MIILKLGGSALTVKNADKPTIDEDNLERIAEEVSYYNDELVIVHGAGSYGHIYAKEYAIGEKIVDVEENNRKIEGMAKIQSSMQIMNYMVISKLQEYGIPAVTIKPSSFIITNNKRIDKCDLTLVEEYLGKGFVPVLYGDAVLDYDEETKYAILSGDQIITYLAKELQADKVILSSDVDGIYTDNPKTNPNAKLIREVTRDTLFSLTSDNTQADVTGGMSGKIFELLDLADEGIKSQIINAQKEGNIRLAVSGKEVNGTLIK